MSKRRKIASSIRWRGLSLRLKLPIDLSHKISLESQNLGDRGLKNLLKSKDIAYATEMVLSDNKITPSGTEALIYFLKDNVNLRKLIMLKTEFSKKAKQGLEHVLNSNITLTELNVDKDQLTDRMAEIIRRNYTLQYRLDRVKSGCMDVELTRQAYKTVIELYLSVVSSGIEPYRPISQSDRERANNTGVGKLLHEMASDDFPVMYYGCKNAAKLVLYPDKLTDMEQKLYLVNAAALKLNAKKLQCIKRYDTKTEKRRLPSIRTISRVLSGLKVSIQTHEMPKILTPPSKGEHLPLMKAKHAEGDINTHSRWQSRRGGVSAKGAVFEPDNVTPPLLHRARGLKSDEALKKKKLMRESCSPTA